MSMESAGIIMFPIIIYFIIKGYHLNSHQLHLLISNAFLLFSLLFNNWFTYVVCLVLVGHQAVLVFNMGRSTLFFSRYQSNHAFSNITEVFFTISDQQIFLILYTVVLWIFIRVNSLKSLEFDMGEGKYFTQLLHGWNCTLPQFWTINLIWLLLLIGSCYACFFLIKEETDRNNLYKQYLLKYKIYIDIVITIIVIIFNWVAKTNSSTINQCRDYYQMGSWVRLLWFWGYSFSTILFFYKKHGVFSVFQPSDQAEHELDVQLKPSRDQIDRQHSHLSNNVSKS